MHDPVRNPYTSPAGDDGSKTSAAGATSLRAIARTGQIITFALIQGLVFISAILLYLTSAGDAPDTPRLWISGCGIAAAIISWIAAACIPAIVRRQAANQLRSENASLNLASMDETPLHPAVTRFVNADQTATLVGQAMLEGGAMINAVLMMVDHAIALHLPLVVAAIIGIAFMTPTVDRLRRSVEFCGA